MKVKEIVEILNANGKAVGSDELIGLLDNIGVEANIETDIEVGVVKKLSKKYGVDIKPVKVKKEVKKEEAKKPETVKKAETKKPEVKKQEAKKGWSKKSQKLKRLK